MSLVNLSQPRPAPELAHTQTPTRVGLLTVEQLAYLGLALIALFAHLWALGERALHHDETLHAAYSWYLFVGRGYMHDPLLHGPLLYYLGSLGYFLFGDNDVTARLMPALAGTALTLTPYLVRRELGRAAALIAAVYLLISPVALYVGRFFRHDIYSVLLEMLVFAAIVRYVSTQQRRWLLTAAAAFGLMLVNQETSYLFLLIMAAPLSATFLWQIYRPGLALVASLGLVVAALIFVLPGTAVVDGSHNAVIDPATGQMQVERPGLFGWPPLPTEDNGYALQVRNRADDNGGQSLLVNLGLYVGELLRFFAHPAVMLAMGLLLGSGVALVHLIWRRPGRDGRTPWQVAEAQGAPAVTVTASLLEGRRWLAALILFLAIYLVFFTAFFTNLLGAISGVAGSLLYWLAQHNVQRGGQPAHYYLFLLSVYEPLLLIFGPLGLGLLGYDWLRRYRATRQTDEGSPQRAGQAGFAITLVAWWAVAAFGLYAWAGEKMPWLTLHMSVPLTLLAAWAAQRVIMGDRPAPEGNGKLPEAPWLAWAIYGALFTAISGLAFVLITAIVGAGDQAVLAPWVVLVAALALVGLLSLASALRWGRTAALAMLAISLGLSLGLYSVRNTVRLSFVNGDIPREPLVYTQTSPDVLHIMQRIEEASIRRGRGLAMPLIYDNETVWDWYLRNFANAQSNGGTLATPPGPEVQAVLMLQENLERDPQNRELLNGFVLQRYPLRWWFPEDQVYRLNSGWRETPLEQTSLLGQLLRAPLDPAVNARWWRFLIFRDPGAPLGSTDFVVAVRPELARQIGLGLGGSLGGEP